MIYKHLRGFQAQDRLKIDGLILQHPHVTLKAAKLIVFLTCSWSGQLIFGGSINLILKRIDSIFSHNIYTCTHNIQTFTLKITLQKTCWSFGGASFSWPFKIGKDATFINSCTVIHNLLSAFCTNTDGRMWLKFCITQTSEVSWIQVQKVKQYYEMR